MGNIQWAEMLENKLAICRLAAVAMRVEPDSSWIGNDAGRSEVMTVRCPTGDASGYRTGGLRMVTGEVEQRSLDRGEENEDDAVDNGCLIFTNGKLWWKIRTSNW